MCALVLAIPAEVWLVRAGVLVALAAGLAAVLFASRGARAQRAADQAETAAAIRAGAAKVASVRAQSQSVLRVLERRNALLRQDAAESRERIDYLQRANTGLESDNAELRMTAIGLRSEVSALKSDNAQLRVRVAALETGTAEDTAVIERPEVPRLPRRRVTGWEEEIWNGVDAPTVADLQQIATPYAPAAETRRHA